jgi:hypothetical protein
MDANFKPVMLLWCMIKSIFSKFIRYNYILCLLILVLLSFFIFCFNLIDKIFIPEDLSQVTIINSKINLYLYSVQELRGLNGDHTHAILNPNRIFEFYFKKIIFFPFNEIWIKQKIIFVIIQLIGFFSLFKLLKEFLKNNFYCLIITLIYFFNYSYIANISSESKVVLYCMTPFFFLIIKKFLESEKFNFYLLFIFFLSLQLFDFFNNIGIAISLLLIIIFAPFVMKYIYDLKYYKINKICYSFFFIIFFYKLSISISFIYFQLVADAEYANYFQTISYGYFQKFLNHPNILSVISGHGAWWQAQSYNDEIYHRLGLYLQNSYLFSLINLIPTYIFIKYALKNITIKQSLVVIFFIFFAIFISRISIAPGLYDNFIYYFRSLAVLREPFAKFNNILNITLILFIAKLLKKKDIVYLTLYTISWFIALLYFNPLEIKINGQLANIITNLKHEEKEIFSKISKSKILYLPTRGNSYPENSHRIKELSIHFNNYEIHRAYGFFNNLPIKSIQKLSKTANFQYIFVDKNSLDYILENTANEEDFLKINKELEIIKSAYKIFDNDNFVIFEISKNKIKPIISFIDKNNKITKPFVKKLNPTTYIIKNNEIKNSIKYLNFSSFKNKNWELFKINKDNYNKIINTKFFYYLLNTDIFQNKNKIITKCETTTECWNLDNSNNSEYFLIYYKAQKYFELFSLIQIVILIIFIIILFYYFLKKKKI